MAKNFAQRDAGESDAIRENLVVACLNRLLLKLCHQRRKCLGGLPAAKATGTVFSTGVQRRRLRVLIYRQVGKRVVHATHLRGGVPHATQIKSNQVEMGPELTTQV